MMYMMLLMEKPDDRWIGPVEAAQLLGVNRSTIQRWIDMNEIRGIKTVGGHRRVLESELRAFALRQGISLDEVGLSRVVAIVDDDKAFVEFLAAAIRDYRADVEIITARSGFEAGRIIAEKRPALIILDLHMPGLDGIEVCRFVRETAGLSWARIVGITGESRQELLDNFTAAGASEIWRKPFAIERLTRSIDVVFKDKDKDKDRALRRSGG